MSKIVFIDTETTSLRPDRRAWEIGLVVREDDREHQVSAFVATDDLDLGNANLFSLKVGRFHERHPEVAELPATARVETYWDPERRTTVRLSAGQIRREGVLLHEIERVTRGAHLVGAVVSFDAEVLATRMRAHGILPSWHHHIIDVEALAVGYLAARGPRPSLPWKSDDLSRACGVEPAPTEDRHTALGDARWAMRLYDKIASGA